MRDFNAQDAQAMLEMAQSAPIQNFHAAKNLDFLFQRYIKFVQKTFGPSKAISEQVSEGVSKALAAAKANGTGQAEVELQVGAAVPESSVEPNPAESTS